jgi:hypothetical protein
MVAFIALPNLRVAALCLGSLFVYGTWRGEGWRGGEGGKEGGEARRGIISERLLGIYV